MDTNKPDLPDAEIEPEPDNLNESPAEPQHDEQAETQPEPQAETKPSAVAEPEGYVNEDITRAFGGIKLWFAHVKERYLQSPHLQRFVYQGKFMPAFWTVTAIFSLMVNILFIAILIVFGHYFFEVKGLVADGLVTELSNNLALMDKAHIVTTVPVETTVQLKDNLPVSFDIPIDQNIQLFLTEDTRIPGATIYLNNTPVVTDLTLPAGTPIQSNIDITIPVSHTIPVDVTVPVSLLVPIDLAIDQTDLHQSIVGLQGAIEPYKVLLGSNFNKQEDFPICNQWWSGWLCSIFFGQP
jgi:hypothetical protein